MMVSAPSEVRPPATAETRTRYAPGCTPGGSCVVNETLLVSSSRSNANVSAGAASQPLGTLATICACTGPRVRLVTVMVKRRGPLPEPSSGHTTRSGVTATSKSWVTNSGRRISPMPWSR